MSDDLDDDLDALRTSLDTIAENGFIAGWLAAFESLSGSEPVTEETLRDSLRAYAARLRTVTR